MTMLPARYDQLEQDRKEWEGPEGLPVAEASKRLELLHTDDWMIAIHCAEWIYRNWSPDQLDRLGNMALLRYRVALEDIHLPMEQTQKSPRVAG